MRKLLLIVLFLLISSAGFAQTRPHTTDTKLWDNISKLKNAVPTATASGEIAGFWTPGDGGGGRFYWDATGDKADHDGGTIIDPLHTATVGDAAWYVAENIGTGVWTRGELQEVPAVFFGYKADALPASADVNSRVVDAALASSLANYNKAAVRLPTGIAYWGAPVTMNDGNTLRGAYTGGGFASGRRSQVYSLTTGNILNFGQRATISDILFAKTGAGLGYGTGLAAGVEGDTRGQGTGCSISRVTVFNCNVGLYLNRWTNQVDHCWFDNASTPTGSATICIQLAGQCNANYIQNTIVTGGSAGGKRGISISGMLASDVYTGVGGSYGAGIFINNCLLERNGTAVAVDGAIKVSIRDNYFEQVNASFIQVGSTTAIPDIDTSMSVEVEGNYFNEYGVNATSSTRAIIVWNAGAIQVANNEAGTYNVASGTGPSYFVRLGGTPARKTFADIGSNKTSVARSLINPGSTINNIGQIRGRSSFTFSKLVDFAATSDRVFEFNVPTATGTYYIISDAYATTVATCSAPIGNILLGISPAGVDEVDYFINSASGTFQPANTVGATDRPGSYLSYAYALNTPADDTPLILSVGTAGVIVSGKVLVVITLELFNL